MEIQANLERLAAANAHIADAIETLETIPEYTWKYPLAVDTVRQLSAMFDAIERSLERG